MAGSILHLVDHAVLKPTQAAEDVLAATALCLRHQVASICVKPSYVPLAADQLSGSNVAVSTVIGFPHGGTSTAAKVAETERAARDGAVEFDMVINLGFAFEGAWDRVRTDIQSVVSVATASGGLVKVILECGVMEGDAMKRRACEVAEEAGAAFVKTSTGFAMRSTPDGAAVPSGATEEDIRLMRQACSPAVGVKASGGIRSHVDATRFVELGATRLGTSGTAAIAAGEAGLDAKAASAY